jgi:pimeloyl-ACP methyl ester carboxylesterase
MNSFPQDSTIVLVHGAWADGSCSKDVILPLERQRLKVICAPIPHVSLTDDVSALTRVLERTGPVVLAGHAYGGAVIGAIRKERVKSFVYIAALAPDEGETVAQVFYRDEPRAEAPKLAPTSMALSGCRKSGLAGPSHKASADETSPGRSAANNFCAVHSRGRAGAGMEGEAVLVSACGRRSHDQSKDAGIYGSPNGREDPLEPCGP